MDRLEQLIERYLDDSLTPDETAELARALAADPAAAAEFGDRFRHSRALEALHHGDDATAVESIMAELRNAEDHFVQSVMGGLTASPTRGTARGQHRWPALISRVNIRYWAPALGMAALLIGAFIYLLPPQGTPVLSSLTGDSVELRRLEQPIPVREGMPLEPGDSLATGLASTVAVRYGKESTRLELKPATQLVLGARRQGKRFDLRAGTLEADVARQRSFQPLIVTTPNARAVVIGTKFTLTAATNHTRLEVEEGKVRLADLSNASAKPVKVSAGHYTIVASATELAALPKTGGLLRECWTNITGRMVLHLTLHPDFPAQPDGQDALAGFSTGVMRTNKFGARLRGFVHPPVTGDYTFWIDARDDALLLLSADENPRNQVQIAYSRATDSSPQSSPIPLVAGRRYAIEALHKVGEGEGRLTVEWQGPGRPREILRGEFLSPERPRKK